MIGSIQISLQMFHVKWSPILEQIIQAVVYLAWSHTRLWCVTWNVTDISLAWKYIFPYTIYKSNLEPALSPTLWVFRAFSWYESECDGTEVSMDNGQLSVNTLTQLQSFQKTTLSRPPNCFHQFCNMKGWLTLLADCTTHVLFKGEYCITCKACCILYPKNHYKDSLNLFIFLMFPQI